MNYLNFSESNKPKRSLYAITLFTLLTLGLFISSYLLYRHNILINHLSGKIDICSTVFGKGCDGALMSSVGTQMGLPLAAWGIIYYVSIILLLLLPSFLGNSYKVNILLPVFALSLIASLFSISFLVVMVFNHNLFCPFCVVIHGINVFLSVCLIKITGYSFTTFVSRIRDEVALLFKFRTFKQDVMIKWLGLATFMLLTVCMYVGLQIISTNVSTIDAKKIITEFNDMPVQKITIAKDDPTLGSTTAPVEIVVFSDFECPYCQYFSEVVHQLNKLYPDSFYVVFKYFPLCSDCNPSATKNIHPKACKASFAAAAANEQNKFWQFHDFLFSIDLHENNESFSIMASKLNLDTLKFDKALSGETVRNKVVQSIQEGIKLNITGTPTVYLNGKKVNDFRLKPMEILMNFILQQPILKNIN